MSNVIFGKFRSLEEAERDAGRERRRLRRKSNIVLKAKYLDALRNNFIEQNKNAPPARPHLRSTDQKNVDAEAELRRSPRP
jgi:hypothetical protein